MPFGPHISSVWHSQCETGKDETEMLLCGFSGLYWEKERGRNNWTQIGNMLIFYLLKSSNRIFYKAGSKSPFFNHVTKNSNCVALTLVFRASLCERTGDTMEDCVQSACLYLKLFWSVLSTPHATQTADKSHDVCSEFKGRNQHLVTSMSSRLQAVIAT